MSIQGPTPFPFRPLTGANTPRSATPAARSARSAPAAGAATPAAGSAPASESSLWELLTADERDFFTQQAALGSITYKPSRAAAVAPQAPTGQRLDVRG